MKQILFAACIAALLSSFPQMAMGRSITELRQIAQAGGSLIIDLERNPCSVTELITIASSLKDGATLTIKMERDDALSTTACLQIARIRPGQIIFWF